MQPVNGLISPEERGMVAIVDQWRHYSDRCPPVSGRSGHVRGDRANLPLAGLALWLGVAQLVAWGVGYARRQGWGRPMAVTAGVMNGILGLAIVVLEVLIH
jgi:hypothetical protein